MFVIKSVEDILGSFVSSNVASDDATEYDNNATYVTGDIRKITSEGTVYKCIANSIVINGTSHPVKGFNPPDYLVSTDATFPWMELRPINRTAMFDEFLNTQTQSDPGIDNIETTIRIGNCDAIALFNVVASEVSVTIYDNQMNQISTETKSTYEQVFTLDDYFFTEVNYKRKVVFTFGIGIGGYAKVVIKNAGSTAKCGMLVPGKKIYLGKTKGDVESPITDYSTYKTDSLGRTKLEVGFYADICKFTIYMLESESGKTFDVVRDEIISLRGMLSVWCVDNTDETWNKHPSLMICGYFSEISPTFRTGNASTCDLKITGVM